MMAIDKGMAGEASLMVEKGANLDAADKDGKTPLMMAIAKGMAGEASLMVEKGANLDAADKDGKTALMMAIDVGGGGTSACKFQVEPFLFCTAGAPWSHLLSPLRPEQAMTEQQFDAQTHQMTGTLFYQCITAMPQYAGGSVEELRLNVRSLPRQRMFA